MKPIIVCVFSLFLFISCLAQNGWQQIYEQHRANVFGKTLYNRYILAGTDFEAMKQKWFIFQVDSVGNLEWDTTFHHGSLGFPESIYATSDSGYIVVGTTNDNAYFIRFNKNNKRKWALQVSFPDGNVFSVSSIIKVNEYEYIAIGSLESYSEWNTILIKFNDPGICLWKKEYFEGIDSFGHDIIDAGNNEYICLAANGWDNSMLFKVNEDGDTLWTQHINNDFLGRSMIPTEDNCFIIRSQYYSSELVFFKSDTNGNVLWTKSYKDNNFVYHESQYMAETFDGGYITSNYKYTVMGEEYMWILKINSDGDSMYSITSPYIRRPYNIMQDHDSMFVFLGTDYNANPNLIKTDSTGSIITKIYDNLPDSRIELKCYPNPFYDQFTIEIDDNFNKAEIKLYDVLGRNVLSKSYSNGNQIKVHSNNLIRGIYFIELETENSRYSGKLIKN